MLPFDKKRKLPKRMNIELVHAKVFYKNAVPALDGVPNVFAPRDIVSGQRIKYHCALILGSMCKLVKITRIVALRLLGKAARLEQ